MTKASKVRVKSFERARELVRSLGLKSASEWNMPKHCGKSKSLMVAVQRFGRLVRDTKGHKSVVLSIGAMNEGIDIPVSFERARELVCLLGLKNGREWKNYFKFNKNVTGLGPTANRERHQIAVGCSGSCM